MVYFRGLLKNLFKKTLYLFFENFVGYKADILENFNQWFDKSFFYYISAYIYLMILKTKWIIIEILH